MSNLFIKKASLFVPKIWQQSVRHRGKFNYKMPRPRHDIARYLEEITKPIIKRDISDPIDKCVEYKSNVAKNLKFSTREGGEFEKFLSKYALNLFENNDVVLICHKLDVSGEIVRRNKVEFKKTETTFWSFNTIVMRLLIENNPKYRNLLPLVETGIGRNYYFFFKEENLKKNLNLMKKMPHFVLLGGMINKKLFTRSGIQAYSQLDSLEAIRSQFCSILNQFLISIPNTISLPINNLSKSLDYSKSKSE